MENDKDDVANAGGPTSPKMRKELRRALGEIVRESNDRLLRQYESLKPLLSIQDVAKTLGVSKRTVEKIVSDGDLRPLWIRGQRRFHPDAINAFVRAQEKRQTKQGGAR